MEIVFEFLFMLLLDGCFEMISSKKINVVIRKIVLSIVTLFYAALIAAFTIIIIKVQVIAVKILLTLVTISLLALVFKLWIKVFRAKEN